MHDMRQMTMAVWSMEETNSLNEKTISLLFLPYFLYNNSTSSALVSVLCKSLVGIVVGKCAVWYHLGSSPQLSAQQRATVGWCHPRGTRPASHRHAVTRHAWNCSPLFYYIIWWVVCFLAWKIYPMNKLRAVIDVNASSHAMRIGKENKTFLSWKSFYNNHYYSKRLHTREEVAVLGTVVPDPLSSCQVE